MRNLRERLNERWDRLRRTGEKPANAAEAELMFGNPNRSELRKAIRHGGHGISARRPLVPRSVTTTHRERQARKRAETAARARRRAARKAAE